MRLASFDDGLGPALYAGGEFEVIGGVVSPFLAKWDGDQWSAVGGGVDGRVHAMTTMEEGGVSYLVVGGEFNHAGGIPANRIARWDGEHWSAFDEGTNGWVLGMTVFDAGDGPHLYVTGRLSRPGTGNGFKVEKWENGAWTPLGSGLSGEIRSVAGFFDETGPKILAGGYFTTTAAGQNAKRIAAWDGSTWSEFEGGLNGWVNSIITAEEGGRDVVFAAGNFTKTGSLDVFHVAKWDRGWSSLGCGLSAMGSALLWFDDGSGPALFVGGTFSRAGDVTVNRIAKWDGVSWSPLQSGVNSAVEALGALGESIFAGGAFLTAGGFTSNRVAEYSCLTPAPNADLTVSKTADATEILPGGTLGYTVTVTNGGPSASPQTILTDPLQAELSCNFTSLGVGGATGNTTAGVGSLSEQLSLPANSSVVYQLTCSVSSSAIGLVVNTAEVSSSLADPDPLNNSAQVETLVISPGLSLEKIASPTTYTEVGNVIDYSYRVTNTGNTLLAGPVTVSDDLETVTCPPGDLDPEMHLSCSAHRTIGQQDLDAGEVTNSAIAFAGGVASNLARVTVTAERNPSLQLAKEVTDLPSPIQVGSVIIFRITATNTGNVTLTGVVVSDSLTIPDEAFCPTVPPGLSCVLTSGYTVSGADFQIGRLTNIAAASSKEIEVQASVQLVVELGQLFVDGFESGDTSGWTLSIP